MPKGYPKAGRPSALERFNARYEVKPNGCWEWTGYRHPQGYGTIQIEFKIWVASRLSWTLFRGPIPEGYHVCHKCDNPPCVNPDHLFLGTVADNMKDRDRKGRGRVPTLTKEQTAKGRTRANEIRKDKILPWGRFKEEDIRDIRSRARSGESQRKIALLYGVHPATICDIVNKRYYSYLED